MGYIKILFAASLVFWGALAFGCPCGCGSQAPMAMSFGESYKFRAQVSHESGFKEITYDGRELPDLGPDSIESVGFGVGAAIRYDLSVALIGSALLNRHHEVASKGSLGDPSVMVRWIPRLYSYWTPALPEVALSLSYKYPLAPSMISSQVKTEPYMMHAFGNGYHEVSPTVELWWYLTEWVVGGSQSVVWAPEVVEQTESGETKWPSRLITKTAISGGYTWLGVGQVLLGLEREFKTPDRVNGAINQESKRLRDSATLTGNLRVGDQKTASLSIKQSGIFQTYHNPSSYTVSMAYTVAI